MSVRSVLTQEQASYAARGLVVVRTLARVFAKQWPGVHESDFVSTGHEAVVNAAMRFDPDQGVLFEKFARHSIWGAMLDLAHRETFIVRRTLQGIARAASETVEIEPSADSWFEPSPVPERSEVLANLRARAAELVAVAFAGGTQALTAEDAVIEEEERRSTLTRLRHGLADLDEKERAFVRAYYEEEETLEAIATRMGVVKRTVQRLHDRIKVKLAGALMVAA